MGLDISVYKNIKQVEPDPDGYSFTAFVLEDSWNDRIKNLEAGKDYQGEGCDAGVSYSYGSHYRFRNLLCEIVLDKEVTKFHETDLPEDMPFIKLIDFADNEGCLDWETSAILYNDFVKWKDKAVKHLADEPHFLDRYMDWLNVFENGKEENTVVVFH